jgi:Zn-dependent M28 family amino/carboxypeptidase
VIETDGGSRKDYGVVMLGSGGSRDAKEERALPQVVVSTEQFNRIARLVEKGEQVELAVDVACTFYDEDLQGYNVVAELPGTDLAHEVVALGAHFDSWHPATGTTDNAIGSAVMIEALRILKASGLAPRRTVRVCLWTGEEQGLLGSAGYCEKHFGDSETQEFTDEHASFAAYFNLDNGGGRIRGIYSQGNSACRPIFEAWLAPFADLGATTVTVKDTGGTDHQSFDRYGLPGFQFIQDPMDYSSRSHHTNMDTYERVHELDAKQASVILASFAYHAAMRAEKLPRKPLPPPEPRAAVEAAAPAQAGNAIPASAPRSR